MEQKIKTRINDYLSQYKNDIKKWIDTNNIQVNSENGESCKSKFLDYMFDYQPMELSKQDFQKRVRAKNNIPNYERCCALRLNGERCTRKKKNAEGEEKHDNRGRCGRGSVGPFVHRVRTAHDDVRRRSGPSRRERRVGPSGRQVQARELLEFC